jgi:hypothetical protein
MNNVNEFARRYEQLVNGQPFATGDGVRFRIIPGAKRPGDLIIELESAGQWRRVKFETVGLLVEFLYRNEDHLYPPRSQGGDYDGGERVFKFLRSCLRHGYPAAVRNLEWEKQNKGVAQRLFDFREAS